jgi:hypothetical protein
MQQAAPEQPAAATTMERRMETMGLLMLMVLFFMLSDFLNFLPFFVSML